MMEKTEDSWVLPLLFPAFCVQGTAAMLFNLLTLICILKNKYLRTGPHLLIGSLTLNDFLHGFSLVIPTIHKSLCLTGFILEMITVAIQFMTYVLMASERRNSLLSLLKNKRKWSMTKTFTLVVTSWILGIGFIVTMILIAEIPPGVECVDIDANIPKWFLNILVGFTLLTSTVTLINYGSIGLMIRSSNHQVTSHMPLTMQQIQRRKSNICVAKMMAMVFGVFFLLYLPVLVTSPLVNLAIPSWFNEIYYSTLIIYQLNFWINPFIYAWRDKQFKKALKALLPKCILTQQMPSKISII